MNYDLTLYYYLKRNLRVCYKTTIGDESRIRCPFCGDSQSDLNDAHLYIHNKAPFKYYCFKCSSYGVVNDNFLNRLIVNESSFEIGQYLNQKRKEYSKSSNIRTTGKKIHKYFSKQTSFEISSDKYLYKLDYLNNRLGTNISKEDLSKFKIILNIQDFFNFNEIDIRNRFFNKDLQKLFFQLRENYIGFLSVDKNVIIFRNVDPNCSKDERYNNFRVFLTDDFVTKKTYTISNSIDIYRPNYNIVITEGVIDILGVYHHLYKNENFDESNYIFLANNGKSYTTTLKYLNSLSLLDNNVTIYSDTDVGINLYRKLKKNSPEFQMNPITVYYNRKEEFIDGEKIKYKDFGVTKDKIVLSTKITL